jgi:DNA-directed RNA polymerase subunit RPC12/RpoP
MHVRDRVGWTCPKCGHRIYGIKHTTVKRCPDCGSRDVTRDGYQMTENGYQMRYACRVCRRHFILDAKQTATAAILELLQIYKSKDVREFTTKDIVRALKRDFSDTKIRTGLTQLFQAGLIDHMGYARTGLTNSTRYVRRDTDDFI